MAIIETPVLRILIGYHHKASERDIGMNQRFVPFSDNQKNELQARV
jgi:hypothetical protein